MCAAYEKEMFEKNSAQDMRESNLRFLKSQMKDTRTCAVDALACCPSKLRRCRFGEDSASVFVARGCELLPEAPGVR